MIKGLVIIICAAVFSLSVFIQVSASEDAPPPEDISELPRPWKEADEYFKEAGKLLGERKFASALRKLADAEENFEEPYAGFAKSLSGRLRRNIGGYHETLELARACAQLGAYDEAIHYLKAFEKNPTRGDVNADSHLANLLLDAGMLPEARERFEKLLAGATASDWIGIFEGYLNLIDALEKEPEQFDVLLWSASHHYPEHFSSDSISSYLRGLLKVEDALDHASDGYEQAAAMREMVEQLRKLSYGGDKISAAAWEETIPRYPEGAEAIRAESYVASVKSRYNKTRFRELAAALEERMKGRIDLGGYRLGEFGLPEEADEDEQLVKALIEKSGSTDDETARTAREKLEIFGSPGMDLIIEALGNENPRIRMSASWVLARIARGKVPRQKAADVLFEAIAKEKDLAVRGKFIYEFAGRRNLVPKEKLQATILDNLSVNDRNLRWNTMMLCEGTDDERVLDKLFSILATEADSNLVTQILYCLGSTKSESAATAAGKYLDNEKVEVSYAARESVRKNHSGLTLHFLNEHRLYEAMVDAEEDRLGVEHERYWLLREAASNTSLSKDDRHQARRSLFDALLREVDKRMEAYRKARTEGAAWALAEDEEGMKYLVTLSVFGPYADIFHEVIDDSMSDYIRRHLADLSNANRHFFLVPERLAASYVMLIDKKGVEEYLNQWIEEMSEDELDESIERVKRLAQFKNEVTSHETGPASKLVGRLETALKEPKRRMLELKIEPEKKDASHYGVEPVILILKAKNISDRPLTFAVERPFEHDVNVHLRVLDEKGRSFSPGLEFPRSAEIEEGAASKYEQVVLAPGEEGSVRLQIADFFKWDNPGAFRVRAKYGYYGHGFATSNEIGLEIKPLDHEDEDVLKEVGMILGKRDGRPELTNEEVLVILEKSCSLETASKIYKKLADTLDDGKLLEEARSSYLTSLSDAQDKDRALLLLKELSEAEPRAYYHIGGIYFARSEYDKASGAYRTYLEKDKDREFITQAYDYLVNAYAGLGEYEEAIREGLKAEVRLRELGFESLADRMLFNISGWYLHLGDRKRVLVALEGIDKERLLNDESRYNAIRSSLQTIRRELGTLYERVDRTTLEENGKRSKANALKLLKSSAGQKKQGKPNRNAEVTYLEWDISGLEEISYVAEFAESLHIREHSPYFMFYTITQGNWTISQDTGKLNMETIRATLSNFLAPELLPRDTAAFTRVCTLKEQQPPDKWGTVFVTYKRMESNQEPLKFEYVIRLKGQKIWRIDGFVCGIEPVASMEDAIARCNKLLRLRKGNEFRASTANPKQMIRKAEKWITYRGEKRNVFQTYLCNAANEALYVRVGPTALQGEGRCVAVDALAFIKYFDDDE